MKKFLILLAVVVGLASTTSAQSFKTFDLAAGDTLVMSSSADTVSRVITATAGYSTAAFKVKVTKISGTVACKAYVYSGDGTDYILTDSSSAFTDQATNIAYFTKTTTPYSHYKIMVRPVAGSTATMQGIVRISYVMKKHD